MAKRTLAQAIREQHKNLERTAQARIDKSSVLGRVRFQKDGTFRLELDALTDSMVDFLTSCIAEF